MKLSVFCWPAPRAGLSVLLFGLAPLASAVDVKVYEVDKGAQYFQTSVAAPIPDTNNGISFETVVKATDTNLVSSVTLQIPGGAVVTVPQDSADEFKLKKKYNKQSSLDANFPNGNYTLAVITAHDGAKTLTLSLAGDLYPSLAPRLQNFEATQALDAGAYFLFTWDTFTAGGTNDFVQLHIDDSQGNKVWETPDLGELGALDGHATGFLMPARTLDPGQTYQANLDFDKASQRDLTSYPGAVGAALYYKRTKFSIITAPTASHSDVKLFTVGKTRHYQQSGSGSPTLQSSKPFNIAAEVDATAVGSVAKATLVLPNASSQDLTPAGDAKTFTFTDDALVQAGLDATYPDGQYTFRLSTASGSTNVSLALTGGAYPNAPHLLNLPSSLDPAVDWMASWEPFIGGSSTDFVQLHIEDADGNKIWETPDYGKTGALTGAAVSATVPRDTLTAGKTYTGRVVFQKNAVLSTSSYPGALGLATYAARTTFTLASGGLTQPHLSPLPFTGTGVFRLLVQGAPGSVARVDVSNDLRQWSTLNTGTLSNSGQLTVSDTAAPNYQARYYRAVALP